MAKLKFSEKCEIKAFCLLGVPKPIIAAVFDVSVNTVMRINAASSRKYPSVFKEVMSFNTVAEFTGRYISAKMTEEIRKIYPNLGE